MSQESIKRKGKNLYFIFNHNSKHNNKERINNKLTCTNEKKLRCTDVYYLITLREGNYYNKHTA